MIIYLPEYHVNKKHPPPYIPLGAPLPARGNHALLPSPQLVKADLLSSMICR